MATVTQGVNSYPQSLRNVMPGPGNNVGVDCGTLSGVAETHASFIQGANIILAAADIIAAYATPVLFLPAVPGKTYILRMAHYRYNYVAAFTGGGVLALQLGNTVHGGGTKPLAGIAASVLTTAASSETQVPEGSTSAITLTKNTGIYVSNQTAVFAAGTGSTLQIFLWYSLV